MPTVSQMQHPLSLDFNNQRKAYMLRTHEKLSYAEIAKQVVNLKGMASTANCVRRAVKKFNTKKGMTVYKYARSGRKAWKLTPDVRAWIVQRLLKLRRNTICTSLTLQKCLAEEKQVKVSDSAIRKVLKKNGYKWLPRAQKRHYSAEDMKLRLTFAEKIIRLGNRRLKEDLAMSMDGVVLAMAPTDPTERENYCKHGETHMWRKKSEAASPELAGEDPYADRIPLARSVPMWGGISCSGVEQILVHKGKKCSVDEWLKMLRDGKMISVLRKLRPRKRTRPWPVICDNEYFLTAKKCKDFYNAKGIVLWPIPPRSPDLNPIEKFWGWLRRTLRRRDLQDWAAKRPPIGRTAFRARVRAVLRAKRTQAVAARFANDLMSVCKEVKRKRGAAARG